MAKSADYWRKRFTVLEEASHSYGQQTYSQIESAFIQAQRDIQREIDAWYARFAKNNGVSLTDAKKMLSSRELAELKWDVNQYIKYGRENAIDGKWMKQLENASAKFHISKLEALQLRTQQAMEAAFGNQLDAVDRMARHILTENYYHSIFEVQKGLNIGWNVGQLNDNVLNKLVVKPWSTDGKNFSDRIWQRKQDMIGQLHRELTRALIQGKSPDEAIKRLEQFVDSKFKNARYAASRLVMTEQAYFHSVSQQEAFKELDVEEFEIISTLDTHTSDVCREMDGKHFPMKDYEAGVTAPPFHPNCRSVTAPYFEDNYGGMRAARDMDGKTYYIPDNTTFNEWKKQQDARYGGGTIDKARKMHYNESADRKQWEAYRACLGNDVPVKFSDFRNLKYDNEEYYSFMKLDFQRQNKLINHPECVLPNADKATADDRKFTEYLFNPDNADGWAKGQAFISRLGYDKSNFSELKIEILSRAGKYPVTYKTTDKFGDKYEQKIVLYGNKGKPANVIVGWKVKDGKVWMTSTYIKEVD